MSTDAGGGQAIDGSYEPVWSPDGTQIAFKSWADNLVPGDTNGFDDVFVKTLATGAIQRVSTDTGGGQATGSYGSSSPAWSPDGTRIAFSSGASNLVAGDTNGNGDVFVKTLATGAIQRVSTDTGGGQASGGGSDSPAWSPDGTRIAFISNATTLVPGDTNGYWDVFVKTLATGAIQRVTTDVGGVQANTDTFDVVWSPDGTQVAFDSWASNLVPGDTNNYQDIFLKTLATGAIQRVSTDSGGGQATGSYGNGSGGPAWSPDGTQIAFSSYADNLVPGDTNGETDVFVKMLATGAVQRVSTDSGGGQVLGGSGGSAWSPDGTQIAFTSNSGHLVTGDTNNFGDVFVKTLATGAVQRVSTDSAGGQAANGGSETENSVWSPDGTQIVFNSDADNLVPGDTNNDTDVFVKTLP